MRKTLFLAITMAWQGFPYNVKIKIMPNIYIRLPKSRCQFFRNRDPKASLDIDEPVVFSPYSSEYFVIRNSLTNASAITQKINMACFSHQQWKNMLYGKSPLGGKTIVKRNPEEYLTFAEVNILNGYQDYNKSVNEDYLAIKLPTEIEVVDVFRAVTPTYNIDQQGVRALSLLLNNDFKRSVVEWALGTFDFCTQKGRIIARSQTSMLERFLMRYGIEPTEEEKDNLIRIIRRWLKSEHAHFSNYSCLDMLHGDSKEKQQCIDDIQWL